MSDLKINKPPVPTKSEEPKLYALTDSETGVVQDLQVLIKEDAPQEEYLAWLEEAAKVVRTSRRSTYGHPLLNFARIASLYNTYFEGRFSNGQFITPIDIVYLNIMTKIAREKQIHKDDNVVDIIGYAATHNAIDNRMRELGYKEGSAAFATMTREEFNALLTKLEQLEI